MCIITTLSHLPGKDLPKYYGPWVQTLLNLLGPFHDKWIHLVVYFILGMSAYKAFIGRRTLHFSICTGFGLFDECHQYFVPGRHFDLMDWAANILGITLALLFISVFNKSLKKYWIFPKTFS
jgi:VanZ family protein